MKTRAKKSFAQKAQEKAIKTGKLGDFCCWPAVKAMYLRHAKSCKVWKIKDRRELKKDDLDIGQGEGCEGGKCEIRGNK